MSEFKRQHPVAAVSRVIDLIKQNFVTILILLFIGTSNTEGYFLYFLAGGFALALIGGFFGWWVFRYRIFEDELQIVKGVFVKNKIYMSKDRIQVIDITEGILQRMFGLVQVEVKTAGSGTESATISAISREEADRLRTELRKKNQQKEGEEEVEGEDTEAAQAEEEEVIKSWKLSTKDLVAAAFTSGNFGLIASILGAISGQLDDFINEETIEYVYGLLPGYSDVSLIIALVLAIIIISWTLSFLGVIFNYSDFKLEKTSKELIITTGLLERKHITVPFDRIQAIRFVEGILRQPLGYGMLYVESAGYDQTQKGRSIVIAPYISAKAVEGFLGDFLDIDHQPEQEIRPSKKAKYRYIRRPNYFLVFAIPIVWFMLDYGWLALLLVPLMGYLGWLRYRDALVTFDQQLLRMRYRVLSRTTALIKKNRIQHVELSQNPFQVRKDIHHLNVMAASGAGGMNFEVQDVDAAPAFETYDWVVGTKNVKSEKNDQRGFPEKE